MNFSLMNISSALLQKQAVNEILKCNDLTAHFGLVLTPQQAIELVKTRTYSLKENGRIEFGGSTINRIIREFCDSSHISMHNYVETLHELIELFYYYKSDSMDLLSDDDLIQFMKQSFDNSCQGSLELLSGRELARLSRNLRFGYDFDYSDENQEKEEYDYEYFD